MHKIVATGICGLVFFGLPCASFAADYVGVGGIDVAHAKLSALSTTDDLQASAGVRLLFDSPFELEGGFSVSHALVQSNRDNGFVFGANVYGGLTFFRHEYVSPNIALGVSGNFYRGVCERIYGGNPGESNCRERSVGYAAAGYRVGFKFSRQQDSRFTLFFSQMFGEHEFQISQLSIGKEFK